MRKLFGTWVTALLLLLGVAGNAGAATVQVFSGDLPGWTAAAGASILVEGFNDAVLVPGFSIVFGSGRPGTIEGGEYRDRADDTQTTKPTLHFTPGVNAFGANWDAFGPGGPGTNIALFLTFVDLSTQLLGTEILSSSNGDFFGIVSDVAISSIRLDEGSQDLSPGAFEAFDADNARFVFATTPVATPAPVSEPTPLLLALFAFAVLCARSHSKKRAT